MKRWIATGLMVAAAVQLWAQAPEMFRYQGRLVNGTNLVNATLPMSFKLYDTLCGGTRLYEDSSSVLVVDGLYSTTIGDNTVFGSLTNAMTNAAVYLELTVNGETLSPRERLVSVPYALNAPAPVPAVGDPAAVSNEVITARWTKNTYANGDITMSDRDTGLMWLHANLCGATNWYAAMTYCGSLTYAGYSDWRLPSQIELASQFYSSEYFIIVKGCSYWSGTSFPYNHDYAWSVDMLAGTLYSDDLKTSNNLYVWPVRDETTYTPDRVISLVGNMDFGVSYQSEPKTATLTIYNYGNDVLTVTSIQYSDVCFSGDWSGTLPAGSSADITVTFIPVLEQSYSGTITVNCNKTSGPNSITCTGTGSPRYIDNGDGTVTDVSTGLMWTKNANHGQMTWDQAVAYCDNLVTNGYSDWRLPSVARDGGTAELDTLFRANGNPSGVWGGFEGTPFTGVENWVYWSGTSDTHNTGYRWYVSMMDGYVTRNFMTYNYYVWPVRGGQ